MNAMKPIHGAPKPKNVPSDMTDNPPVPCEFKPGDVVTYTNDYGVKFRARVRGFKRKLYSYVHACVHIYEKPHKTVYSTVTWPGCIYLEFWSRRDRDWGTEGHAWWVAHDPKQLKKESAE